MKINFKQKLEKKLLHNPPSWKIKYRTMLIFDFQLKIASDSFTILKKAKHFLVKKCRKNTRNLLATTNWTLQSMKRKKINANKKHIDAWKNSAKAKNNTDRNQNKAVNKERLKYRYWYYVALWCVVYAMCASYRTIKIEYWLRACTQQSTSCQTEKRKKTTTKGKANKHEVKWNEDSHSKRSEREQINKKWERIPCSRYIDGTRWKRNKNAHIWIHMEK